MAEYNVAVSAFGNIRVEADDDEAAVEAINEALAQFDTGDLDSPVVDYVTNETADERWEQREARDRGVKG